MQNSTARILYRGAFLLLFITLTVTWSSCRKEDDEDPDVTGNDEVYINEISSAGDDWIEVYNNNNSSKDLTGYKIYDDPAAKYTLPAGTSIAGKGYLIIFCDDGNTGLHTNFKLTSSGETVWLENPSGDVVDKVIFPMLLDNECYARFPDGGTSFSITGNPTAGATNGNSTAISIISVGRSPKVPGLSEEVTVNALLGSTTNVSSIKLFYRINSGAFSSAAMTGPVGTTYTGKIPAMNSTGLVEYYVEAKTSSGETTLHPATAPAKFHDYLLNTDVLPQLVINEFMAVNVSCCPDNSSGAAEYDDWIEIYNAGAEPVNIADYYLSDDIANPFNSKIPDTNPTATTIQPGAYLIIWADGQRDQGELHVDFKLLQEGESLGLYYKDGRKIDEYSFGAQTPDQSVGRKPDGTGAFQVLTTPTRGAANN